MYPLYLLFSKYRKEVQGKALDVFGLLTSLNEDSFLNFIIDLCKEYTSKSEVFKIKIIQTKRSFSPICEGNHWRRDCLNRKFKNKNGNVRYVATNDGAESDNEIHQDHFANVCIKTDRLNEGSECLPATFLGKEKTERDNDHMVSDLDSFVSISYKRRSNVKSIGSMIPMEEKSTETKHNYTTKIASYALKMFCNLLTVSCIVSYFWICINIYSGRYIYNSVKGGNVEKCLQNWNKAQAIT